jgi:hypothetical protein
MRSGKERLVHPIELLGEMELQPLDELYEKLEMVDGSRRTTGYPAAPNLDDKAAIFLQDPLELLGEAKEPLDVLMMRWIAVALLTVESKRRGRHDGLNRLILESGEQLKGISPICSSVVGAVLPPASELRLANGLWRSHAATLAVWYGVV